MSCPLPRGVRSVLTLGVFILRPRALIHTILSGSLFLLDPFLDFFSPMYVCFFFFFSSCIDTSSPSHIMQVYQFSLVYIFSYRWLAGCRRNAMDSIHHTSYRPTNHLNVHCVGSKYHLPSGIVKACYQITPRVAHRCIDSKETCSGLLSCHMPFSSYVHQY